MKQTLLSLIKKRSSLHYLLIALLILGFLGFLDATYLTILHFRNVLPPCSVAHGCETVLTSKYATAGGIPIALLGAAYYLTILVLTGLFWQLRNKYIPSLLLLLTTAGLLVGIYLVYLQAFVIHAYCQYCLSSELIDFLLFDVAWWLWRRNEKMNSVLLELV